MAGGVNSSGNQSYYLRTGQFYWTMSPYGYDGAAPMFVVYDSGNISNSIVTSTWGVRPVINLKANTALTGSGSATDPYTVQS